MRRAAAFLVSLTYPAGALGQDAKVRAEALFQEAKDLAARGEYEKACPKFLRSQKLDPATGTLLNLASCYEKEGKSASAWAAYKEAAAFAHTAGQIEREKLARERAAQIEPTLPYVTVSVSKQASGLEVRLDGNALDPAEYGTRLPVDPGDHIVEASAPGKRRWETRVSATAGTQSDIVVPELEEASAQPLGVKPAPPPRDVQPIPGPAPKKTSAWPAVGVGTMAAGAGGIVLGSIFGVMALDTKSTLDRACGPMRLCGPEQQSRIDDLATRATVSTVAFIAGGIFFAAGLAMVLVPVMHAEKSASMRIGPGSIEGRF
jgi:hypothetical protein